MAESIKISKREKEIIKLIASGLDRDAIGDKLFISPKTVSTHLDHIRMKLKLHNCVELAIYAFQNKLVNVNSIVLSQ